MEGKTGVQRWMQRSMQVFATRGSFWWTADGEEEAALEDFSSCLWLLDAVLTSNMETYTQFESDGHERGLLGQ
jgi:hypothetical protein